MAQHFANGADGPGYLTLEAVLWIPAGPNGTSFFYEMNLDGAVVDTIYRVIGAGSSVSQCFTAGTKILTGKHGKTVGYLRRGDWVASYNELMNRMERRRLLNVIPQGIHDVFKVSTNTDEYVTVTRNHPFLIRRGHAFSWTRTDNLLVGDELVSYSPDESGRDPLPCELTLNEVDSITYAGKKATFDLTVEGTHNFLGNGLVLHNTTGVPSPLRIDPPLSFNRSLTLTCFNQDTVAHFAEVYVGGYQRLRLPAAQYYGPEQYYGGLPPGAVAYVPG